MQLNAIILAGGLGTRLREVVSDRPKPMALVNNRPFIEYVLQQMFTSKKISNIYICVGYMGQQIIDHVYSMKIPEGKHVYFSYEEELLGTGGAIKKVIKDFNLNEEDNIIIANGDSFLNFNIDDLYYEYSPCIASTYIDNTSRYGLLEVENSVIYNFTEKTGKSKPGIINCGYYCLPVKWFDIPLDKFSIETEVLIKHLPLRTVLSYGGFIDIGIPEDYKRASWMLAYQK